MALLTVLRFTDKSVFEKQDNIYLAIIVLEFLVFLLPAAFYMKLKGRGYFSTLMPSMFKPEAAAFVVLSLFALIFGSAGLRFVTEQLGVGRGQMILMEAVFDDVGVSPSPAYMILTFALAPALCEELIFRGIMLSEYKSGGRFCGVFMSSLLFAFLHFGFENFLQAFFLGAYLAFAVSVTGSLPTAMLLRFFFALYELFLENQLFNILDRPNNPVFMIFILFGAFLAVLFFALGCAEKMFFSYSFENRPTPERDDSYVVGDVTLAKSLISIPFAVTVVMYVIISAV